jgi:hypothetical protein
MPPSGCRPSALRWAPGARTLSIWAPGRGSSRPGPPGGSRGGGRPTGTAWSRGAAAPPWGRGGRCDTGLCGPRGSAWRCGGGSGWLRCARHAPCDGDRVTCTARAWSSQGPRQRGPKRQALQGETCCPVLLAWGVRWWHGTPLALALDATALGTRLGVLAGSGVDRGWALPGAWGAAGPYQTCLAAAGAAAPGHAPGLAGDGVDGAGLVGPLAVAAPRPSGRAPVVASQHGGHLAARGDFVLASFAALWAPAPPARAGLGHGLSEGGPAGGAHLGGRGGGGLDGPLLAPDRPAA